ncbi:MAG: cytochrome C oxidase subunit IV family protein [Rhodocyclaceae bacterium]|nr:cytochrome C oxidase subunit IV family protein [Rhodocyclaceae bacterium]
MSVHFLNVVWLALMVATVLTWLIGKAGQPRPALIALVLVISALKGWLIIEDFMALRRVRLFWRAIMLGWLMLTLALILLAYWLGLR